MNEQIVMRDSPEAAQYRTDLKGWVSRNGYDYGDGPHRTAGRTLDAAINAAMKEGK